MKLTMLITTYNRAHLLRHTLARLVDLTHPDELLIVDDGSNDDTEQVATEFANRLPITYIYNHNPQPSICSLARNIGFNEAENDVIVTCEPELIYVSDVLRQFEELHLENPNDIISAGLVHFAPAEWDPTLGVERLPGGEQAVGWVAPYTALWWRPWVLDLGGWDESFPGPWGWDDTDLLTRLRIAGHGQTIALHVEAIHQWHPLGADNGSINELHWLAKSFHGDETNTADLVANQGKRWGRIIPRS